ncbi:retinal-binding protein-like isoform X2 [Lineus longissimus]|uniref:retinal-binding protein-like isoform X2 n=1 Tax=Lineus longissimus TaxID=88925 RepID=UPI002B4D9A7E
MNRRKYKLETVEESIARGPKEVKEEYALKQFKENIQDIIKNDHDDFYLRRWLKARNYDVKKTTEMYRASMTFKEKMGTDKILDSFVLPEVLKLYLPGGLCGHDKDGAPLKIEPYGNLDMRGIMYSAKKADLERSRVHMCETIEKDCKDQSKKLGKKVNGMTVVFDMEGVAAKTHIWRPGIVLYLHLVSILEDNYPEMMKRLLVINAPAIFPILYRLVRPLITEEMKQKIHVIGGNYRETLLKYIDASELPAHYGGTKVDVNGDPKCSALVCQGGKVPESFYLRDLTDRNDMESASVVRGDKFTLDFNVEKPGSYLRWEFKTEGYDIGFGVFYKDGDNLKEVLPVERVNSHMIPHDGNVVCQKQGTYVVVFDNSFSWTRGKKIFYTIEIVGEDEKLDSELEEISAGLWQTVVST